MDTTASRGEAGSVCEFMASARPTEPDGHALELDVEPDDEALAEAEAMLAGATTATTTATTTVTTAEALDDLALAQLLTRVMRQDEAALAALYEQLAGRVYALALRVTRDVSCAEEVMQDTFWQVWRQAPRFDAQRGSAVAWVLMMARSRALDAVRARSREPVHNRLQGADDDDGLDRHQADTPADDPLDLLQAVRRDSALHAQLARLDPLRRQLIALAFFRGMTHDEIASHTGLPLGTVKSHFRRTLAALQTALAGDGADAGGLAAWGA